MNIFANTLSALSHKAMEITNTQETEFINDIINDKIQHVGVISFHPRQRQIRIDGGNMEEQKTYKISNPTEQLIKLIWVGGDAKLKKHVYHYLNQGNQC